VAAFVEKPDARKAARYLRSGQYLWNAGMFFLTAERMRAEVERQLPRLDALMKRLLAARHPGRLQALVNRHYGDVESISIDYGIMERAAGIRVVKGAFGWSDVGSWSALADIARHSGNHDDNENVLVGDVMVRDSHRNIVVSDPGAPFVGVVGVADLVVVATADGVLVVPRGRAQDVRQIVDALKAKNRAELLDREPAPVARRRRR
jgi:mannose-1-phosphate guanylyltransferase